MYPKVRRSEWVIFAFLVYAPALGVILQLHAARLIVVNALLAAAYAVLIYRDSLRPSLALSVARDWLPLAFVLLAYREMGWFAVPHTAHPLETRWVAWDRSLLRGGARTVIESMGVVVPSVLEICYSVVYAIAPFAVAILYLYRSRDRVDRFLFIFTVAVLLCYAQFPFWPSDPPRVLFPSQDPPFDTVFRRFNLWMLGNYGIHTSVFPSAHVAGAFAAAFGIRLALPRVRWVRRFLLAMAVLIATATVYGRYHYAADAVAGFAIAVASFALGHWRRLQS